MNPNIVPTNDSTGLTEINSGRETWWAVRGEEAASLRGTDPLRGLTSDAAALKAKNGGLNRLTEPPGRTALSLFFGQFKTILVAVLAAAAVLSAAVGDLKDAVVITFVVVLNALVGFWQEYRAEKSLSARKQMLPARARVRRYGQSSVVPAETLVEGDVVLLEAGDRIPADGRLLFSYGAAIDESALTGESQAADKDANMVLPLNTALADRRRVRRSRQDSIGFACLAGPAGQANDTARGL